MARAKRSLSSLLDDEEAPVQAAPLSPIAVDPPKPESTLVIVPAAEPVAPVQVAVVASEVIPAPEPAPVAQELRPTVDETPIEEVADPEPAVAVAVAADDEPGERPAQVASVLVEPVWTAVEAPARPKAARQPGAVRQIKAAAPEPQPDRLPLYLELTRKEARFRQDQLNALTTLTRQINRRRGNTGDRITDNTLIRVAVDMLLHVADSLTGVTETDLLEAMTARLMK